MADALRAQLLHSMQEGATRRPYRRASAFAWTRSSAVARERCGFAREAIAAPQSRLSRLSHGDSGVSSVLCRQTLTEDARSRTTSTGMSIERGDDADERSADQRPNDGTGGHGQHEPSVLAEHDEAAVAAVARERDEHRGERDGERQAPGDLDIDGIEQHERRNQQLAARDAHERRDDADAGARDHASDNLNSLGQREGIDGPGMVGHERERR